MQHSTNTPTKAEQARIDAVRAMPCIACEIEADISRQRGEIVIEQPLPTEAHHLVDKGYRVHSGGHMATIPLCRWHHRGELVEGYSSVQMRDLHGPSLALSKKSFKANYGTERALLEIIDQRLAKRSAA